MNKELQLIVEAQNVAQENALQLIEAFGAPFTEAGEILLSYKNIIVSDESQSDLMKEAREKRLVLKKIRTTVESKRKSLKENALRTGKAIDGVAKYIRDNIQPAEDYLEEQEKFAEIRQAKRAAELKASRITGLMKYTDDISIYNFNDMTDEKYDSLLDKLRSEHEAMIAEQKKIEDERIANEKARAEEQERIRLENEKLKAEAEEREDALRVEREKIAAEQAVKEAELQKERAERERLELENQARLKAEAEEKAAQEAQERKALVAPDKEKIASFNIAIETIRNEKLPVVQSKQAKEVVQLIDEMLIKMHSLIETKLESL